MADISDLSFCHRMTKSVQKKISVIVRRVVFVVGCRSTADRCLLSGAVTCNSWLLWNVSW